LFSSTNDIRKGVLKKNWGSLHKYIFHFQNNVNNNVFNIIPDLSISVYVIQPKEKNPAIVWYSST